jgi:hypothetical protein
LASVWKKFKLEKDRDSQILLGTSLFGWVGALVTFIFLPLMQSVNLMVFLWFFLGLSVGKQKLYSHASTAQ